MWSEPPMWTLYKNAIKITENKKFTTFSTSENDKRVRRTIHQLKRIKKVYRVVYSVSACHNKFLGKKWKCLTFYDLIRYQMTMLITIIKRHDIQLLFCALWFPFHQCGKVIFLGVTRRSGPWTDGSLDLHMELFMEFHFYVYVDGMWIF